MPLLEQLGYGRSKKKAQKISSTEVEERERKGGGESDVHRRRERKIMCVFMF
jgi:hypothetical protein